MPEAGVGLLVGRRHQELAAASRRATGVLSMCFWQDLLVNEEL